MNAHIEQWEREAKLIPVASEHIDCLVQRVTELERRLEAIAPTDQRAPCLETPEAMAR